jgi:hypothetical protein
LNFIVLNTAGGWVFCLLYCAFLTYIARTRGQLPEQVASHFRFDRVADGWMNRRTYLVVWVSLATGLSLLLVGLSIAARMAGANFIASHLLWAACLLLGLLIGVYALTIHANRCVPARLPRTFWTLLGAFQLGLFLWVAAIITHDRWGWPK